MSDEKSFEDIILDKIDKRENLTEKEIEKLIWTHKVETDEGDSGRWTCFMSTIVKLKNRYFQINWQKGLTEYQDNIYDEQPEEVLPFEKVVTKTVTLWIPKQQGVL